MKGRLGQTLLELDFIPTALRKTAGMSNLFILQTNTRSTWSRAGNSPVKHIGWIHRSLHVSKQPDLFCNDSWELFCGYKDNSPTVFANHLVIIFHQLKYRHVRFAVLPSKDLRGIEGPGVKISKPFAERDVIIAVVRRRTICTFPSRHGRRNALPVFSSVSFIFKHNKPCVRPVSLGRHRPSAGT